MNKAELKIDVLSYAKSQVGNYILILSELNSSRKLPIIIKPTEAQFIAVKIENIAPARPMTYDLFKSSTDNYNIIINNIYIYNVISGIFYAKINTSDIYGTHNIESTVGDALAIAALYKCPIYVEESVMESSSIDLNMPAPVAATKKVPKKVEKAETADDLNEMLQKALSLEEYELAVEIRDKISKLKNA